MVNTSDYELEYTVNHDNFNKQQFIKSISEKLESFNGGIECIINNPPMFPRPNQIDSIIVCFSNLREQKDGCCIEESLKQFLNITFRVPYLFEPDPYYGTITQDGVVGDFCCKDDVIRKETQNAAVLLLKELLSQVRHHLTIAKCIDKKLALDIALARFDCRLPTVYVGESICAVDDNCEKEVTEKLHTMFSMYDPIIKITFGENKRRVKYVYCVEWNPQNV